MDDGSIPGDPGFKVLANPVRLEILGQLTDRLREQPDDPVIGFSDLRRAVGMRDSGNFNYHLDQLRGGFVRKADGGYRITAAGIKVVAAAIAGGYGAGDHLGPRSVGDDCPVCAEALTAEYEHGRLTVSCSNEHVFGTAIAPGSVDGRELPELIDLLTLRTHQHMALAVEGVCPFCEGQLQWSVDAQFDSGFPTFDTQCDRCGARVEVPAPGALLTEPAVVAFYHRHGIDIRRRPEWSTAFYRGVSVDGDGDPLRIAVTITLDDDTLRATLDETLTVQEIETNSADG
jgi:DNA-binding transcriptional ArsR family regulator